MANGCKSAFDVAHPFFLPLWRRAALTAFILGWAGVELWHGNGMWALLFGAAGVYLFVQFFLRFDPKDYKRPDPGKS